MEIVTLHDEIATLKSEIVRVRLRSFLFTFLMNILERRRTCRRRRSHLHTLPSRRCAFIVLYSKYYRVLSRELPVIRFSRLPTILLPLRADRSSPLPRSKSALKRRTFISLFSLYINENVQDRVCARRSNGRRRRRRNGRGRRGDQNVRVYNHFTCNICCVFKATRERATSGARRSSMTLSVASIFCKISLSRTLNSSPTANTAYINCGTFMSA